ncbi:hypothetical protein, partial [Bacillus cereus]|uniref:hypothetical protein n=1 Tax=Bacillus cereus TaxID=1396 RepID=UPI0036E5DA51
MNDGVEILKRISESAPPRAALDSCRQLASLDPSGYAFRVKVLRRVMDDQRAENWYRLDAAEQLLSLGETDGLCEFARSVVAGPEQNGHVIERAGEVWLALAGRSAASEVSRAVASKDEVCVWALKGLAMTLLLFGIFEGLPSLVKRLFDETADDEEIDEVVSFWIDNAGTEAADQIVDIMRSHPAWNSDERPTVARRLLEKGYKSQAAELVRMSLASSRSTRYGIGRELALLVEILGADADVEVLGWCETLRASPEEYARVMDSLVKAEASPMAILPLAKK